MTISPSEFVDRWGVNLRGSDLDRIYDDLEALDTSSFGPKRPHESNQAVRARARFGLVEPERSRADSAADPGAQLVSASVGAAPPEPTPPPPPPPPIFSSEPPAAPGDDVPDGDEPAEGDAIAEGETVE